MPRMSFSLRLPLLWTLALLVMVSLKAHSAAGEDPLASLEPITARLASGQPVIIATFGDSITWPCYHTDYRQNYITFTVDALRKAYPQANVKIVHAGNMGSTGRGLTDGRFDKQVLVHKPDVVFLMFGMNDCGGGAAGLQAYDENLTTLCRKTREAAAVPIVATQNEIIYSGSGGRQALPLYMARAIEVARREKVPAVDCYALWKPLATDPPRLAARLNDYFHPNHAGHRLMASAILSTLWPKAAEFVSLDQRTQLKPEEAESTACLLPGPPGKQVLRTADGTWYAISGQRRNQRLTDLIFSFSRAEQPEWQDFRHISLVGARDDAVFDAMDRTLTAGMLLEKDGKVYVVFSSNVGVFFVTTRQPTIQLDLTKPPQVQTAAAKQWEHDLTKPESWLEHQPIPVIRPTTLANCSYRDGALLYDAYLQPDGWPAALCSERELPPGGGFEVNAGVDGIGWVTMVAGQSDPTRKMLFPDFHVARCVTAADGVIYCASQVKPDDPLQVGVLGAEPFVTTHENVNRFLLASRAPSGIDLLIKRTKVAGGEGWSQLFVSSDNQHSVQPLANPSADVRAFPLPWCDGVKHGIVWWNPQGSGDSLEVAYESQLLPGSQKLGVVSVHEGGLQLQLLSVGQ